MLTLLPFVGAIILMRPLRFSRNMEGSVRARRSRQIPRRQRPTPYPLRSSRWEASQLSPTRTSSLALERKDWEDATCSVCMEFPHNAVLLLCSSHDKGCRPYMCGTSYRHSNCLDQFKKAYTKVSDDSASEPLTSWPLIAGVGEKSEVIELAACPLCRGQVKGWTVVQPARDYLNGKKRSCMQDDCSFTGSYKELHKHVKSAHPCARPREVDPTLEQKWRRLEHEREREDVMSTIRSSMPRSVVFGDYVIEMTNSDLEDSADDEIVVGSGGDGGGNGRGISRSILYFFLREGTRLMRLQRETNGAAITGGRENDDGGASAANLDPSVATVYSSGGDDDDYELAPFGQGRGLDVLRADRRRRRRRRSRGRSVVGSS